MTIDEYADIPASCPDVQVVDGMGFGRQPGRKFDPNLLAHIAHGFEQSVNLIAKALNLPLERFRRVWRDGEREGALPVAGWDAHRKGQGRCAAHYRIGLAQRQADHSLSIELVLHHRR